MKISEDASMLSTLQAIADLAHCGGLCSVGNYEFGNAVRRLTLPYWVKTPDEDSARDRVVAALALVDRLRNEAAKAKGAS